MKKTCLLLFALVTGHQASSQQFSAGLKSGITNWFTAINTKNPIRKATDGQALGWEKELFGRYSLKNGLAFELGVGHTSRKMEPSGYWFTCGAGCDRDSIYIISKRDYYLLNISAQRRVLTIKKRFSTYLGLIARPGRLVTENIVTSYSRRDETVAPATNTHYYRQFTLALGLSNTSEYSIGRHLTAYATVSTSINMLSQYNFNGYRDANTRLNGLIGLGYTF